MTGSFAPAISRGSIRFDVDGYVRITGRLKDLIIRGGVNISPAPIENALADHPDVNAVAVIGHPDERLGERICAVVVPDGKAPSLDDPYRPRGRKAPAEASLPRGSAHRGFHADDAGGKDPQGRPPRNRGRRTARIR